MYLDGSMRLLQQSKSSANSNAKAYGNGAVDVSKLTAVKDVNMLNANLTYQDAQGNYFRTLDKTQTKNPMSSFSTNNDGYSGNESLDNTATGAYSEVQAMQSGILAYAPANASYSYVLDEETELEIAVNRPTTEGETTTNHVAYERVQVPAGTLVMVDATLTDSDATKAATVSSAGILTPSTGKVTVTSTSGATNDYTSTVYVQSQALGEGVAFVPQNIEYESFTPMSDGLYLFLRNEKDADQTDPEFSGYYATGIVTTDDDNETIDPSKGTFFALNTGVAAGDGEDKAGTYRSDYTVKGATGDGSYAKPVKVTYDGTNTESATLARNIIGVLPSEYLELFNAQYSTVDSPALKWYFDATNKKIYAVYDKETSGDSVQEFDKDNDIVVEILLNSDTDKLVAAGTAPTDAESWAYVAQDDTSTASEQYKLKSTDETPLKSNASNLKFYYNNDVEAGDSTVKLVDKVKLYEGVTNKAYLAFDFDLNVHLDSVQVTFDENGKELDTAIAASPGSAYWKATKATGGATGAKCP